MSGVAGIELKTAVSKANDWGTAVGAGVGDGVLILPESIKKTMEKDVDDSEGNFWSLDGTLGPIKVEGSLPAYLRYDSLDLLIGLFMGASGGAPVEQGAEAAYAYLFKWAGNTDGLFATMVRDFKNYILEIPSFKVAGMTIKGDVGKPLQVTFDLIGINKVIDSVVNTLASFADVTWAETMNRIRFSEGVFRMNDQSDVALGEAHIIYPSNFELTAKRNLKGVYDGQFTYVNGSNVQDLIDEPTNDGAPTIDLKMTFPRHTATTYLAALGADTRKKMDMTFTGGLIAGSYYRQFVLQFPHLQLINDDPADAKGIITEPLEFTVHGTATAPAGMIGITDPFEISGINQMNQDVLA